MVFSCNYKNYLMFVVDWFTREQLMSMHYIILTDRVGMNLVGIPENVLSSISVVYPKDLLDQYAIDRDYVKFRENYLEYLNVIQGKESALSQSVMVEIIRDRSVMYISYDEDDDMWTEVFDEWLHEYAGITPFSLNQMFSSNPVAPVPVDKDKLKKVRQKLMKHWRKDMFKNAVGVHKDDPGFDSYRYNTLKNMTEKELNKFLKEQDIHNIENLSYNEKFSIAWDIVRTG